MRGQIIKNSPIKTIELRSAASINFGSSRVRVAHYRLISYATTVIDGTIIDSPFSGELYFVNDEPPVIQDTLVMHYDGSSNTLHQCKLSSRLDEVITEVPELTFGIEFSYATKNIDG